MFQTTGTFSFSSRQFLCFFHLNYVSAKLQVLLFSALLDFLEFAFATLSRLCGFIRTAVSMCCYLFILEKYRDSNKSNNLPPHWKAFFCREHLHIFKHVNKIGLAYWRPKQKVLVRWHQSWNFLDLCFTRLNLFLMHLFYLFPFIRCFCFVLLKVFFIKSFLCCSTL